MEQETKISRSGNSSQVKKTAHKFPCLKSDGWNIGK